MGEAVAPGIVGRRAAPLCVVLQVGCDLLRCVSGEALLHERGEARHMRRSLTRTVPGAVCTRRASVSADYVRLGSVVGCGSPAAEAFDCVCVDNTRRARGEHAGISALGRVADAAGGDVILQVTRRTPHQ